MYALAHPNQAAFDLELLMSVSYPCAGIDAEAAMLDGDNILDDDFAGVIGVGDARTLETAVRGFASRMVFDRYTVLVIDDDFSHDDSCVVTGSIHNAPPAYSEWHDRRVGKRDPVTQHCKRSSLPLVYDRETYLRADFVEKWEHQAPYGFASGICSAFHLPLNKHVVFGVDCSKLPVDRVELSALVGRVHLFGTYVQCAAVGLLSRQSDPNQASAIPTIRLSPREYECLQWAAEGKTAWETGMLLSIAEATVAKILASALRKLDCATKPQAVVKALRLGLIH